MGPPQLDVGNGPELLAHALAVRVLAPGLAEEAVVEHGHLRGHPGREVDAVGHGADGHVFLGVLGPDPGPHVARDLAVQAADAVVEARQAQGQHSHAEMLGVVAGVLASQGQEDLPGQTEVRGVLLEVPGHELGRKAVVARGNRRVGREDRTLGHDLQSGLEGQPAVGHECADALQAGEGRVPLVHVNDPRRKAQGAQGLDAADAQQVLLHEPHLQVPPVQLGSQFPALRQIFGKIGVHEIKRHPSHIHAPDAEIERLALHVDAHLEGASVGVENREKGHLLEIVRLIPLLLPAVVGQVLPEKAPLVAQADAHQGDVQIAGRLEMVPGQDAEAPGIDGQALGQAVFGAEVGHDGPLLLRFEARHGPAPGHVLLEPRHNG
ncbi:hypothetical protein DSECCO2_498730 [anaerobic digester metagenome]